MKYGGRPHHARPAASRLHPTVPFNIRLCWSYDVFLRVPSCSLAQGEQGEWIHPGQDLYFLLLSTDCLQERVSVSRSGGQSVSRGWTEQITEVGRIHHPTVWTEPVTTVKYLDYRAQYSARILMSLQLTRSVGGTYLVNSDEIQIRWE